MTVRETVRTLIVDDEPDARERIREILADEPTAEIVGEAGDGLAAATAIRDLTPDLVFLDVRMPEASGFDVLAALGNGPLPLVVFVTAYDSHAIEAFEVHAVDYVLKPFDRERLLEAFGRARRQAQMGRAARGLESLLAQRGQASQAQYVERILAKAGAGFQLVSVGELDWIEAAGNYVTLHRAGRSHLVRHTITRLERQLDPRRFRRIHRSIIVNLDRVREIQPNDVGEYDALLADGTRLRIGRSYRAGVLSDRG